MTEQTVNIYGNFVQRTKKNGLTLAVAVLALFSVFATSACMPTGNEKVNAGLFKNKEDMKSKCTALTRGMSQDEAFKFIGVSPVKFEQMSTEEIQYALYGNSQVHGTPDQLEEFKKRLLNYDGYALPYKSLESNGSLGFGKMKVQKTGYNLKLVLIFEKGKLLKSTVVGQQQVEENEDQYFWQNILTKGIGAVL